MWGTYANLLNCEIRPIMLNLYRELQTAHGIVKIEQVGEPYQQDEENFYAGLGGKHLYHWMDLPDLYQMSKNDEGFGWKATYKGQPIVIVMSTGIANIYNERQYWPECGFVYMTIARVSGYEIIIPKPSDDVPEPVGKALQGAAKQLHKIVTEEKRAEEREAAKERKAERKRDAHYRKKDARRDVRDKMCLGTVGSTLQI